jgi:glycosyltransferase involved in cell wall biosynthesis
VLETRPKRFLIDASMIQQGGGFTVAINLVPQLVRRRSADHFRVYVRNPRLAGSLPALPNLEVVHLPAPALHRRLAFSYFESVRIAREWEADAYLSFGEYAPLWAPCPVVATFQNACVFSPLSAWGARQRMRLSILRVLARLSARRCDRIQFVSESSANWMGEAARVPAAKRIVIWHGIDAERWRCQRVPDGPLPGYILSVSSVYRYKNYVRLIQAWGELARRRADLPDLVIVGDDQDPSYFQEMQRACDALGDLSLRVHLVGEVFHEDMPRYFAGARLFVYPSYCETFGLPLLEAMASGVPLVAGDTPISREIADDAAFYADPFDSTSIACAIEEALYVNGAADALRKRGLARVEHFTWEGAAEKLSRLFDELTANPGDKPQHVRAALRRRAATAGREHLDEGSTSPPAPPRSPAPRTRTPSASRPRPCPAAGRPSRPASRGRSQG